MEEFYFSLLIMPSERLRTKESSRAFFPVSPSPDAETCYFFHKLLWNCLVAALIITKNVKSIGPFFRSFYFSIDRFMRAFCFARHIVARFAVLDHVFMFIHYFIDTFFRSSDPSFSWFITKYLFYRCAQVTFSDEEMYLWSLCGLITRKKRNEENQHSFGVSCR